MEYFRRAERLPVVMEKLSASPNRLFTLAQLCELFDTAKSTMSEDVEIIGKMMKRFGLGEISTIAGAAGGVRFRPGISGEDALAFLQELSEKLQDPERLLPGGYLYLSDILSMPDIVRTMGLIIATPFYESNPDFVLTMETKGIPVALMTAQALGVPLVIARRASKVYEGSAVNINYVSGSSGNIETMSLSRRAVKDGQKALIVDDVLKAGATAKGMMNLMKEFSVEVVGCAFVIAKESASIRQITGEKALMTLSIKEDNSFTVRPSEWIGK